MANNETSPATDEVGTGVSDYSEIHARNAQMRFDWLQATYERAAALKAGDDDTAAAADARRDCVQEEFFIANRRLAMAAVKEFLSRATYHLSEDYEQAALYGMWVAFAGGDPTKRDVVHRNADGTYRGEVGWDPSQATFGGYSRVYIKGAVQRAVASSESGLTYAQWSAKPKVSAARDGLREQFGSEPSAAQIAAEVGMRPDTVRAILTPAAVSTQTELGDGFTLGDTLVALAAGSQDSELGDLVDQWVARAADKLTTVELLCVLLRRGLAAPEPLPIIDTAARLGINRGRVTSADKNAWPKVEAVMLEGARELLGVPQGT